MKKENQYLKIQTDGSSGNTHVFSPKGEEIKGIISVNLNVRANQSAPTAWLEVLLDNNEN